MLPCFCREIYKKAIFFQKKIFLLLIRAKFVLSYSMFKYLLTLRNIVIMKKIFAAFVFALISVAAFANPWSYHGPKRDIVSLVVTANYEKPRLLAELIQVESRQPFLLLPAGGDGNIYFCPPRHLGNPKFVGRQKLGQVIAFIAPKQIIVLGNERYVPNSYVAELRKVAPVFVVNAESWEQAAEMVAPMLNLSKLPRNYRKLSAQLESGRLYIPKQQEKPAANDEVILTDKAAEKDDTVAEEPVFRSPQKKAPAKKAEEQYPAFDADEKPAKGAKSADIAPLA